MPKHAEISQDLRIGFDELLYLCWAYECKKIEDDRRLLCFQDTRDDVDLICPG